MALRRVALGFAAVVLILLAVSFSLFRLLLPEIPELQRDIEAMASEAVGKPLVIGEMEAEWAGWGPRLVFKNVSIRSPIDNDELVALGQLTLGTHFLQLLSDQPWRPASVDAEGLRLVVEQKGNGSLRLRGFDGSESNEGDFLGPLLDFLAARGTISLGRTEIVWVPAEGTQLEPESAWFDLAFRSGGGRYHIELSGKPPASIGEDVELVLDAEGSMADMVNMRGEVFTRVGGFQLHSPWVQPLLAFLPIDVKAGYLENGDVSLRWDRQKTTKVTSRVSLTRLQVSLPNESEAQKDMHLVEGFEGDLSWASHGSSSNETDTIKNLAELGKRWTLSSESATLTVAGEPIQIKGFEVDSEIGEDALNEQHFVGKLGSLTWGRVFDQAEGLPLPDEMGNLLQRLAPAGGVKIKRFDVARSIEKGTYIEAAGQFDRLSWRAGKVQSKADDPTHKGWPGLKNVSGSFDLKGNKIALNLDSPNLVISWPWLYSGERSVDSAKGDFIVNWSTPAVDKPRHLVVQSDNLQLRKDKASADVQVGVDVALTKPKVTGWLTLDGDVRGGTVPMVKEFIPAFTPDTAHQWLEKALLVGELDAEVAINGPLNGFPYENDEGKFSADAYVVNAGLQFAEQWPAVENASGKLAFRNMSLMADIEKAATAGIPIQKLRVQIPTLKRANVKVRAEGASELPRLLAYVRQSPLLKPVEPLMKGLTGGGNASLSLNLEVPVTDIDNLSVAGELALVDARFHSSDLLQMNDINGRFDFTRERVVGRNVSGMFHGFDSLGQLDLSLVGGDMLITAETQFDPIANLEQRSFVGGLLPDWFLNTLSGSTALSVDLSGREGAPPAQIVTLRSSLEGLTINGPNVLSKSAEWQAPFKMVLDRSVPNGMRVTAQARGLGGADLWLADDDGGELRRAEFAAGNAIAQLPEQDSIGVVADFPRGDFEALLEWFNEQQSEASEGQPEAATPQARNLLLPDFLDYVKLRSDRFHAFGITWHALDANIRRTGKSAVLKLTSADGSGTIRVPDRVVSSQQAADIAEATRALQKRRLAEQIQVDFDYLYIPDLVRVPEAEAMGPPLPPAASPIDPRELPVVKATIKDSRYMGVRLGRLEIETEPGVSGLIMRRMRSRGGWLDIDASGRWDVYGEQHNSEISVGLASKDWDAVMNGIELPDVLGANDASMQVNLQWPGAITNFDAEQASGGFSVDFSKGQIYQVDPGIGRILGLFSFYTLPRRLLLDFSDIAKAGLTFDKIRGDFTVNNGNAWTDNLVINARGADAAIVGRAGMVAQDYDQRITVKPQIGGGTAVVGALVSGVGVGALLLLTNELLGQPFDDLGVLRFHLTGSWDEPLINGQALPDKVEKPKQKVDAIRFGYPYRVTEQAQENQAGEAEVREEAREITTITSSALESGGAS